MFNGPVNTKGFIYSPVQSLMCRKLRGVSSTHRLGYGGKLPAGFIAGDCETRNAEVF